MCTHELINAYNLKNKIYIVVVDLDEKTNSFQ